MMAKLRYYLPALLFFWFFLYDNPAVLGAIGLLLYLLTARYAPDFIDKTLR
jgi:hypothetical protein